MRKVSTSRTKKFTSGQSWVFFFSRARKSNYCSTGGCATLATNHMANATDNARSQSRWTEVCIPRAAANRAALKGQNWAWHWELKSQLIRHGWKLIKGSAQQRFSLSLWHLTVPDNELAFKHSPNRRVWCICTLQQKRKAWRSSKRSAGHNSIKLWSPCEMKCSLNSACYSPAMMWHSPIQEILFCKNQKVSRF